MIIKAIALQLLAKYPVASQHLAGIVWEPCSDADLAKESYLEHTSPLPAWEYGNVDCDLVRLLKKEQQAFIDYFYSDEAYEAGIVDDGNLKDLFTHITDTNFVKPTRSTPLGSSNDWARD